MGGLMDHLEEIQLLDCSGTITDVLSRLSDKTLESLISDYNRYELKAYGLLALRLAAGAEEELTTNRFIFKKIVEKTVLLVNLERMRRDNLVTLTFPRTLNDDTHDLKLTATEKGKERLKNLTAKLP
jgi:hypothetical protein